MEIKLDQLASSFEYDNCKYVANLMGSYRKKEVMEKRVLGTPTEYKFEDFITDGIEHYRSALQTFKGMEKRKTAYEYIEIDLKNPT